MKKRDFIFIVIVIAIAIIFGMISLNVSGDKGKVVFVSVNGDTYGEFSLYIEQKIDIRTENGYNTFSRLESLLSKFKLQDRKFNKDNKEIELNIDYTNTYKVLKKEQDKSKKFIKDILDNLEDI